MLHGRVVGTDLSQSAFLQFDGIPDVLSKVELSLNTGVRIIDFGNAVAMERPATMEPIITPTPRITAPRIMV